MLILVKETWQFSSYTLPMTTEYSYSVQELSLIKPATTLISIEFGQVFYSLKSICRYWSESDSSAHHAVPWEPVGPWFSLPRPGPWLASSVDDAFMASSGIWPSSIPSSFNLAMKIKESVNFVTQLRNEHPINILFNIPYFFEYLVYKRFIGVLNRAGRGWGDYILPLPPLCSFKSFVMQTDYSTYVHNLSLN